MFVFTIQKNKEKIKTKFDKLYYIMLLLKTIMKCSAKLEMSLDMDIREYKLIMTKNPNYGRKKHGEPK